MFDAITQTNKQNVVQLRTISATTLATCENVCGDKARIALRCDKSSFKILVMNFCPSPFKIPNMFIFFGAGWSSFRPYTLITLLSQNGIGNYSATFHTKTNAI